MCIFKRNFRKWGNKKLLIYFILRYIILVWLIYMIRWNMCKFLYGWTSIVDCSKITNFEVYREYDLEIYIYWGKMKLDSKFGFFFTSWLHSPIKYELKITRTRIIWTIMIGSINSINYDMYQYNNSNHLFPVDWWKFRKLSKLKFWTAYQSWDERSWGGPCSKFTRWRNVTCFRALSS